MQIELRGRVVKVEYLGGVTIELDNTPSGTAFGETFTFNPIAPVQTRNMLGDRIESSESTAVEWGKVLGKRVTLSITVDEK